jgi:hypothetical protein
MIKGTSERSQQYPCFTSPRVWRTGMPLVMVMVTMVVVIMIMAVAMCM